MNNTFAQQINGINIKISDAEKTIKIYKKLAVFSISAGFVSIAFFFFIFYFEKKSEYHYLIDVGTISGGIVASLFSLAGLILVYVAFLGQKQQLLYQQIEIIYNKEELKLTRDEMKNQQVEMKKQNDTLELQKFENIFFQLLNGYQNSKSYMLTENSNFFMAFVQQFIAWNGNGDDLDELNSSARDSYMSTIITIPLFNVSFITQANSILKFILSNESTLVDKKMYFELFTATISPAELKCIYLVYNYDESISFENKNYIADSNLLKEMTILSI